MPHIEIKCYPGRTEEQKQNCAKKVAQAITETLNCPMESISLAITEIPKEEWKQSVWDKEIAPKKQTLCIKPGYTCD